MESIETLDVLIHRFDTTFRKTKFNGYMKFSQDLQRIKKQILGTKSSCPC